MARACGYRPCRQKKFSFDKGRLILSYNALSPTRHWRDIVQSMMYLFCLRELFEFFLSLNLRATHNRAVVSHGFHFLFLIYLHLARLLKPELSVCGVFP